MMVMQYAKEGSLRKMLDKNYGNLSWENKIKNMANIAKCLARVHNSGLVHKDLHNGNIVMQNLDGSYVTDFGLCKPVIQDSIPQDRLKIYGVLPYLAPEVLSRKNYTKESDIYSFGIIMSEVLTGYPPYHNVEHDAD